MIIVCFTVALCLSILSIACDEEVSKTEPDCRQESNRCTEGFECQLNVAKEYECQPVNLSTNNEAGTYAGAYAGSTAGTYAGSTAGYAGIEAGTYAGTDAGTNAGIDAGTNAGTNAGTDAGTDAGTASMGDCDVACNDFAQCIVDECTGYSESDFDILKESCLETCTPVLANLFESKVTCREKFEFVSTVNDTFFAFCNSTSNGFCERYTYSYGEWESEISCEDWYNNAAIGTIGDTTGASQACYNYHVLAAEDDPDTHCPHARGEQVCVD